MKKVALKEEPATPEPVSLEAALWGGHDSDRSLEMSASALESRLAQLDAADEAVTGENATAESGEHSAERGDPSKPKKPGLLGPKSNWKKGGANSTPGATSAASSGTQTAKHAALQRPGLSSASHSNLTGVGMRLGAGTLRAEKPPDAWSLLREAKGAGVFFKEDSMRDGHSEEAEDPELAAAVEEAIRLLFGVRGILRVGGGKNEKSESILVVVASHGFSDASLASVPEKVHRFRTVVAIPFELLPLRRDR